MIKDTWNRISSAHLRRAASIRGHIEELEKELTGMLGIPEAVTLGGIVRRRRKMSAAAGAKIAAAARARWAKIKRK